MKKKKPYKNLFEREMRKASFHKKYIKGYPAFKIEVQLLRELEKNGMTYLEFARAIGTSKSNISRDLKRGGIDHATLSRLKKMANVLKCVFIPLIIPLEKKEQTLQRIEEIINGN